MPELSSALQQQRTVLIYVDEPAVQGGGLQPHPDCPAERHGTRPPRHAHRRKAVLAPALYPGLEMVGEPPERVRRQNMP